MLQIRYYRSGIKLLTLATALGLLPAGCRFAPLTAGKDDPLTPMAQFIIGSTLLGTAPVSHDPHLKAARYRELQAITGMRTTDVAAFLAQVRDDPEKARKLHDTIQLVLAPRPDSAVNKK